ncbi:unnamed protein product, partial [Discosporangium mesarthrocarpum]
GDLFGYILDLTGGVTASLTSFIFPALVYIYATEERGRQYHNCLALGAFGVVVMVLVPVGVVLSIVST